MISILGIFAEIGIGITIGIYIIGIFENIKIRNPSPYRNDSESRNRTVDMDAHIKEILKKGTGSSRTDLQNWWNDNHPNSRY